MQLAVLEKEVDRIQEKAVQDGIEAQEKAAIAAKKTVEKNKDSLQAKVGGIFPGLLELLGSVEWVYHPRNGQVSDSAYGVAMTFQVEGESETIPCKLEYVYNSSSYKYSWNLWTILPEDWFSEDGDFLGGNELCMDKWYEIAIHPCTTDNFISVLNKIVVGWLQRKVAVGKALAEEKQSQPAASEQPQSESAVDTAIAQWVKSVYDEKGKLISKSAFPVTQEHAGGMTYLEWLTGQALAGGCSRSSAVNEALETIKAIALLKVGPRPQPIDE